MHQKADFCPKGKHSLGQSPLQNLEEGPRSGLYLLVSFVTSFCVWQNVVSIVQFPRGVRAADGSVRTTSLWWKQGQGNIYRVSSHRSFRPAGKARNLQALQDKTALSPPWSVQAKRGITSCSSETDLSEKVHSIIEENSLWKMTDEANYWPTNVSPSILTSCLVVHVEVLPPSWSIPCSPGRL